MRPLQNRYDGMQQTKIVSWQVLESTVELVKGHLRVLGVLVVHKAKALRTSIWILVYLHGFEKQTRMPWMDCHRWIATNKNVCANSNIQGLRCTCTVSRSPKGEKIARRSPSDTIGLKLPTYSLIGPTFCAAAFA